VTGCFCRNSCCFVAVPLFPFVHSIYLAFCLPTVPYVFCFLYRLFGLKNCLVDRAIFSVRSLIRTHLFYCGAWGQVADMCIMYCTALLGNPSDQLLHAFGDVCGDGLESATKSPWASELGRKSSAFVTLRGAIMRGAPKINERIKA
jgi:hypothetical protein